MDDKTKVVNNLTDAFKESMIEATKSAAAEASFWQEFWKVWIPGGRRKRKRHRTQGHGKRKDTRRRQGKAARIARRKNRRVKKRRKP
jgi:hypothetical protein